MMDETARELKKELQKSLGLLRTLRDEVRVKLHLASMDVKDQWKKIEPHLQEAEKAAEQVSDASRAALNEALKKLEKFRSSL
jgi:lipid II:glycine glycyltransferase (peptidoglycan interpeptide bridge formation enzyme)